MNKEVEPVTESTEIILLPSESAAVSYLNYEIEHQGKNEIHEGQIVGPVTDQSGNTSWGIFFIVYHFYPEEVLDQLG